MCTQVFLLHKGGLISTILTVDWTHSQGSPELLMVVFFVLFNVFCFAAPLRNNIFLYQTTLHKRNIFTLNVFLREQHKLFQLYDTPVSKERSIENLFKSLAKKIFKNPNKVMKFILNLKFL